MGPGLGFRAWAFGLGLWVSSEIMRLHGGALRFRSSPRDGRHGTVFSMFFHSTPLADEV